MSFISRITQAVTAGAFGAVVALAAACGARTEAGEVPRPGATAAAPENCAGDWELVVEVTRPLRMRIEEISIQGRITLGDVPGTGTFRFPIREWKPVSFQAVAGRDVIGQYTLTNSGTWRKGPPLNRDVTMTRNCIVPPTTASASPRSAARVPSSTGRSAAPS